MPMLSHDKHDSVQFAGSDEAQGMVRRNAFARDG
jgi:hypothetical protein